MVSLRARARNTRPTRPRKSKTRFRESLPVLRKSDGDVGAGRDPSPVIVCADALTSDVENGLVTHSVRARHEIRGAGHNTVSCS